MTAPAVTPDHLDDSRAPKGMSMTDQKIEEIRTRAERATPGPLELMRYDHGGGRLGHFGKTSTERKLVADFFHEEDREFYYHALTDIPFLLTELDRLKAALAAATNAPSDQVECSRCKGNGEIVTDWDRYLHAQDGDKGDEAVTECPDCDGTGLVATLKASGTFRDGLEAAAKWHEEEANYIADKASFDNADRDGDVRMHLRFARDIRALSPQSNAQAQRERDTAFNAGIEAAAKVASEVSNRLKSESDTHKMYGANQVWHAIRALAKGE